MKQFITLTIALFLISCSGNKKGKNEQITKFESSLGNIETMYLNELVNEFDSFLDQKYNDKESKFKEYLSEISVSDQPDIWNIDKNKFREIQNTNLVAKYDSIYPDSVWYENNVFNVSYSRLGISNSVAFIKKENQELNIDSLINTLKAKPRLEVSEPGYFQIALGLTMTEDTLVQNYLDTKQTAGKISLRLLASGLLHDLKSEEYFAKRILIIEMNNL